MSEQEIWNRENVSPEEWEAYAVECDAEAVKIEQEKFRIQDEDGFPVYHNKMIAAKNAEGRLARQHGVDYEYGLVDLDGNFIDAKIVDGKYGSVWCVQVGEGQVAWVNVSQASSVAKQQAFYAGKGYQMAKVYYHYASGQYSFYANKKRGVVKIEICE